MGRIGLVLGAGGVVGHAFHAGVLAALQEETGWDARHADLIVGTSAGSGVAALLRAGLSPADLLARATGSALSADGARLAARVGPPPATVPSAAPAIDFLSGMAAPTRLLAAARRPWEVRLGTLAAAVLPAGRVSSELIAVPFRSLFDTQWPARPTWICAVQLDSGRRVVFGRDGAPPASIADAVAASCAIPSFFTPVTIGGTRYVDGGAHSPTNVDVVSAEAFDLVIVSSPMSTSRGGTRVALDTAARRLFRVYLGREAEAVRRSGVPVVAFQPSATDTSVMGVNAMDATRRKPVAEHMHGATRRRLQEPKLRDRLAALRSP
ncbi:MAG: patatin-like phospholipase family protein [Actinobacteria bacterium]|nr:MAG: patatin-like phospholipase family protein [Actinomycetota bacterium]